MEQKKGNFPTSEQTNSLKISYDSSENWNEDRGSINPRFTHDPSNSVNMTAGPRPVLNYSIETGEEFALEFMLKSKNPRQPYNLSPPVEANNESSEKNMSMSRGTKVLCSFGGKILPCLSDEKLRYVGGETRILRIGKEITWDEIRQRTLAIYPEPHSIKYQLPGEDLDLLVSVTCEEDVQNMMDECSVIGDRGSRKLRVFLVSDNESDDSQLVPDNVDGNSDGSQQMARDSDCIDKNEPNHESEMKSASDSESALTPLEIHGDIIIDINDRFRRDLLSDIFPYSDIFGTAESSVGIDTHTAGLSVNMESYDPQHWSFFRKMASGEYVKDVLFMDQDHPFAAGLSAADQRQSSGPSKPDIVTLPSDYDISQTNGVESMQSNQEISSRPVVSDHQDVKRAIQPAGVLLVDKNELNHESERKKMNEKDKSAHFGVDAGTSEHGEIFLDINNRFPQDFLSDIFRTAESSVGVVTHG